MALAPDLQAQETEVTTAVINAIKNSKEYCQPIQSTPYGGNVIETCKLAGQAAMMFKQQLQGLTKPYIVHKGGLLKVCQVVQQVMGRLRQMVTGAFAQPTAAQQQQLLVAVQCIDAATAASQNFLSWIDTSPAAYMSEGDLPFNMVEQPPDAESMKLDMNRTPRWIIKEMFNSRSALALAGGGANSQEVTQLKQQVQQQQALIDSLQKATQGFTPPSANQETFQLKQKLTQQQAFIDQLQLQLKSSSGSSAATQQRDQIIATKDSEIRQLKEELLVANRRTAEFEHQVTALKEKVTDPHVMKELKEQVNHSQTLLADRDEQITKLSVKLKQLFDSNSEFKKREKDFHGALQNQLEKVKQLESKLRLAQAQLRMSRINADELTSGDMFRANLQVELEEMKHGGELEAMDKMLDHLFEEHGKDNETVRNALQFEMQQIEATDDALPTVEVDYKTAANWMSEGEKRLCLAQILLDSTREFEAVRLLGQIFLSGKSAEDMARSLINIYHRAGRALELIYFMIDTEIKNNKSAIQLFRGEEFPPRMIRVYTRLIGIEYAQRVLGDIITEICQKQLKIELDPGRAKEEGVLPVAEGQKLLEAYCQRALDAIVNNLSDMPLDFIRIANHLTKQTKKKWNDISAVQGAVAGFIFLRFFCPCLASPENFDFPDVGPMTVRRSLLLIGKVLQSLANGVNDFKEDFLQCMTPFLERNRVVLEEYVRHVREWPPRPDGDSTALVIAESLLTKAQPEMRPLIAQGMSFEGTNLGQWKQNIETQPLQRLRNLLAIVPQMEPPGPIARVNRLKFPGEKEDILIQSLLMTYADSEGVPAAITKALVAIKNLPRKPDDEFNPEMVVHHLGVIFLAHNSLQFLMKSVIENEISGVISAYDYLHNSISKYLFVWYCKNYVAPWLAQHWSAVITSIVEQNLTLDPINMPETTDRLKNVFLFLVNSVATNVLACPFLLWEYCSILSDYTSQDVFQFLFMNFLAPAIDDPVGFYLLSNKPDAKIGREAQKTFTLLSQMMRDLANKKPTVGGAVNIEEADLTRWTSAVDQWCSHDHGTLIEIPVTISWKTERESLLYITDYILVNRLSIEPILKTMGSVQHNVMYNLSELLSSLKPPEVLPSWDDVERVSSPFIARGAAGSVSSVNSDDDALSGKSRPKLFGVKAPKPDPKDPKKK